MILRAGPGNSCWPDCRQRGPSLLGAPGRRRRARRPCRRPQQHVYGVGEGRGLAALELRRRLSGFDELILQGARPIEDVFDETGGNSFRGAEALRQVEHQSGWRSRSLPRACLRRVCVAARQSAAVRRRLPAANRPSPASASATTRPAARLPVRMLRRRVVAAAALGDEGLRLLGRPPARRAGARRSSARPPPAPASAAVDRRGGRPPTSGARARRIRCAA